MVFAERALEENSADAWSIQIQEFQTDMHRHSGESPAGHQLAASTE